MICQRCTKSVGEEGVHTCTPTELVRKLEAENKAMKATLKVAKSALNEVLSMANRGSLRVHLDLQGSVFTGFDRWNEAYESIDAAMKENGQC